MFDVRSNKPERIDTGDYTREEYETFLREIAFINRYLGDGRALKKTLLKEIENVDLQDIRVLDVGCGSGELLRMIAEFGTHSGRNTFLTGLDLNPISSSVTQSESRDFADIVSVQGDAFRLPFAEDTFDYAISSLFFHHLTDDQIVAVLREMRRVSKRGIFIIDLHRDPMAYAAFKVFCFVFGISPLVRDDGSLSIKKGFRLNELKNIAGHAGLNAATLLKISPGRVVMSIRAGSTGV